jgi:hypothetical protein
MNISLIIRLILFERKVKPIYPWCFLILQLNYFKFIFQFTISIYYFNLLFQFTISICYFNLLFQFTISIYYFNLLFQFTISIYYFNLLFQFTISIYYFNLRISTYVLYLKLLNHVYLQLIKLIVVLLFVIIC